MGAEHTDVEVVAEAIRAYLRDHPHAADTVEGIARWWLSAAFENPKASCVQHAVEQLVSRGEMTRRILRDGTVIFERNKERDE